MKNNNYTYRLRCDVFTKASEEKQLNISKKNVVK